MKTIILATDFSANASRAARFACQLAHDQKATLILFHAFHVWPDNPAKTGDFPLSVDAMRESSEKALHRLANELSELVGPDVYIRCLAQEGHTMNAVRAVTKAENADLLFMSTVGTGRRYAHCQTAERPVYEVARSEWPWAGRGGPYRAVDRTGAHCPAN